jgi:putative aminopeptidase FrvX
MTCYGRILGGALILQVALPGQPRAQTSISSMATRLASMTAITGYEQAMVDTILGLLPGSSRDRAGNARIALGGGKARRLVVCPLDEPGYVVGGIRDDGYLTLRRSPGRVSPLFDQQLEGHRTTVQGKRGPVPGVVAVRSIHLTRGRTVTDTPFTVDDAYVDVGASTREEATRLGIAVLAPVTLAKRPHHYGDGLLAAPVAGRRAACAALLQAVHQSILRAKLIPPLMVGFAVEHELSERGLGTLATTYGPFDETLIVDGGPGPRGRFQQGPDQDTSDRWPGLGRVTQWSLPVTYRGTQVETVSLADADSLQVALVKWIGGDP